MTRLGEIYLYIVQPIIGLGILRSADSLGNPAILDFIKKRNYIFNISLNVIPPWST